MEPGGISELEASDELFRGLQAAECAVLPPFGHESELPWVHRPLGESLTSAAYPRSNTFIDTLRKFLRPRRTYQNWPVIRIPVDNQGLVTVCLVA